MLDFEAKDVAKWIRANTHWNDDKQAILTQAADIIEEDF